MAWNVDRKRKHTEAMRRTAEVNRCPECGRTAALVTSVQPVNRHHRHSPGESPAEVRPASARFRIFSSRTDPGRRGSAHCGVPGNQLLNYKRNSKSV